MWGSQVKTDLCTAATKITGRRSEGELEEAGKQLTLIEAALTIKWLLDPLSKLMMEPSVRNNSPFWSHYQSRLTNICGDFNGLCRTELYDKVISGHYILSVTPK